MVDSGGNEVSWYEFHGDNPSDLSIWLGPPLNYAGQSATLEFTVVDNHERIPLEASFSTMITIIDPNAGKESVGNEFAVRIAEQL